MDIMTEFEPIRNVSTSPAAGLGADVLIVAGAELVEQLRAADAGGLASAVTCLELAPGEPVPTDRLAAARILVVEVDPAVAASVQRVRTIRSQRPALPVVAALRGMDVAAVRALLRHGVADVVELPFSVPDLVGRVAEVQERMAPVPGQTALGSLFCVIGGTGGCGATTVLTHLAARLASGGTMKACVVDLDLQSGEVAYYLGLNPRVTVETLIQAGDRIDEQFIRSAITDTGHGFSVIAAPDKVMRLDEVDVEELLKMLSLLRQQFDIVLVDLPSDWTNWSLSVASAASSIVLVTELSVAGLRQSRRRLDLFASVGIESSKVELVANRVGRGLFRTIDLTAAETAVGHPFSATLADEEDAIRSAQDEGRLLGQLHRHSRFDDDLRKLADKLIAKGR
jgi:pilus assembly protein CpaE